MLRRTVGLVALLNLAYFGIEFGVATAIGSVSLFADAVDFLEDAAVNSVIFAAMGWSAKRRALTGMLLAGILLIPSVATIWTAWHKISQPSTPGALPLTITGLGALAINLCCAFLLVRFRKHCGSLTRAAFLSARNDVLANVGIVAAGVLTAAVQSPWPDFVVGLGIFAMNLDAARQVYRAAREERRGAEPG
jgi:Co/Zn/Cd efflux system component